MKIRQNDISKFDIAICRKFRYSAGDTIRYDISISNRYFRYVDTALIYQSASCEWVSGLRECPLVRESSLKYEMAFLRLSRNILIPVRNFAAAATEGIAEGGHEGNFVI